MEQVPNIVLFKQKYKAIVQNLVLARKDSGLTKEALADWLNVDRRKIFAIESLKKVDLETLLLYADKYSVEIELNFKIR